MLAKCTMAGRPIHQYRSHDLPGIPVINAITVANLTKIKMFLKIIFIQLLLFCVQSSTAVRGPQEIFVQPVKPAHDVWTTKNMHSEMEGVPGLDFLNGHYIPGLDVNKTKNIYVEDFDMEKHIIDSGKEISPYFGMLPLFMEITGKNYEMVGQRNAVVLPADGTFKLACVTYGIPHFTTYWTDGDGKRVYSVSKPSHDGLINYDAEVLTLNVYSINSTSFGCEFKDQLYGISHYKWFNFTLVEKPDVIIYTDNNTCGQVTFTCLDGESQPEKVILNFTFV